MQSLFKFIEALCILSTVHEEDIVTQWGNVPIVIEPGDKPLEIYRNVRTYGRG